MYAIRFDQLQQLLSREPGQRNGRAPGPDGITAGAVDQVIRRWMEEPPLVQYERIFTNAPGWIWPTPAGERLLGLTYARHHLRASRLTHRYYINLVRLDYERRHPGDSWTSERAILAQLPRREPGEELPHVPDGIITRADGRGSIAVEVELSPKADAELDAVLLGLLGGDQAPYRGVWYFVSDQDPVHAQAWRAVEAARQRLPTSLQTRMQIVDLAKVGQNATTTAAASPQEPPASRRPS
jgi:hypothetical protein